jgi:O-antigen/teichoic acid export membrane protein
MKPLRRRLRQLAETVLASADAARAARGSAGFLLIQVVGVGLAYLVNVAFARNLGPEGFGAFIFAYTWRAFLVVPALAGLAGGTLRFVPAYLGQRDWPSLAGFLRFARTVVLGASLSVALLTVVAVTLLRDALDAHGVAVFWWAAASLIPHAVMLHASNVLRGLGREIASQLPQWVLQPALQLVFFLTVIELGLVARSAEAAMITVVASTVVVLGVVARSERLAIPVEARSANPVQHRDQWIQSMTSLFWIQLVAMAMDRADVLVLGLVAGPTEAGLYAAAGRVASLVGFGLAAVNAWAAPTFSERHARGEHERLQDLVRASSRLVLLFTLPAVIGVWVLGRQLLGLFGSGFEEALTPLIILTFGQFVAALTGPVGFLLPMTGSEALAARILAASAVLNLVLNVALVSHFGTIGAAIATSVARLVQNVAMAIAVWHRIRIRTTVF